MANKGLYYYKLVSPYPEDVTKDCKLTINEIDSNFKNLKDSDVAGIEFNEDKTEIILRRNDGDNMRLAISEVKPEFSIDYNEIDGVIDINYDNDRYSITGLVTKENLSREILTRVYSDGTLKGIGTSKKPLMVAPIYKTGHFAPVSKLIDTTVNERLPREHMTKGDRYITLEEVSDYGMLYNFDGVKHINRLLAKTGWRVPTKDDWDNMLNAIEPCEFRDHNSTLNNRVLGKLAGSLLKSREDWRCPGHDDKPCHCDCNHEAVPVDDEFDVDFDSCKPHHGCGCGKPMPKPVHPMGKDAFGMGILPAGYAYFSRPMQYTNFGIQGAFWTTDMLYDSDVYTKVFTERDGGVLQIGERPSLFLSIRLVKDYDGTNHNEIENILGKNYRTVLMPSLNNPNGFTVWTAQNIDFVDEKLEKCLGITEPNAGLGIEKRKVYFIYEWNGFGWDKAEMGEGDSVTILQGDRSNELYNVVNGVLVNVNDRMIDIVSNEVSAELNEVAGRVSAAEEAINEHDARISNLETSVDELQEDAEYAKNSIDELKSKDEVLQESITAVDEKVDALSEETATQFEEVNAKIDETKEELEESINTKAEELQDNIDALSDRVDTEVETLNAKDAELEESISNEEAARTEADEALQENLDVESEAREAADTKLTEDLAKEAEERKTDVELLTSAIETEAADREKADDELTAALDAETEYREQADQELTDAINAEKTAREEAVTQLTEALADEASKREEANGELAQKITDEEAARTEADAALTESIQTETSARTEADNALSTKIDDETAAREAAITETNGRVTVLEGKQFVGDECVYDNATGVLTLPTQDGENTIKIQLSSDYGTLDGIIKRNNEH